MPTTVTARTVLQENRQANAALVQALVADREFPRGIEGAAEVILLAFRKRGLQIKRRAIPVLAASTSAVISIGNNQGFDPVLTRAAEGFARPEDVFPGISATADAREIMPAGLIAGAVQRKTLAWTGRTGVKVEKRRGPLPLHTVGRNEAGPANAPVAGRAISEFGELGRQRR
jgi:hypothetical protein